MSQSFERYGIEDVEALGAEFAADGLDPFDFLDALEPETLDDFALAQLTFRIGTLAGLFISDDERSARYEFHYNRFNTEWGNRNNA